MGTFVTANLMKRLSAENICCHRVSSTARWINKMNGNSCLDNICFFILTHSLSPPQEVLQHLGSMQLGTRASPCRSTHLKIANPGRVLWRYKGLQHSKTEFRMTNVCINWLSHVFLKLWGTEGDSTHPPFFPILKNSLMHHMTLAS